jgi:hypothetical protein
MQIRILNFFFSFLAVASVTTSCVAFVHHSRQWLLPGTSSTASSVSLHGTPVGRRDWMAAAFSASATTLLIQGSTVRPVVAADGVVDYSKIQDLLGSGGGDYVAPYRAMEEGKRPTWLTEPTSEFKESEQKAMEFKRKNLMLSKQFLSSLDTITSAPNSETTLVDALDALRRLVKSNGGLPIGITKDEIIKICRRRKSKKYWPTSVEIAYVFIQMDLANVCIRISNHRLFCFW